jgi:hypothetical protein
MKSGSGSKLIIICLLLPTLLAILSSCATIGPNTIARDRFDYSGGLATSWQRQMLLNIVKMRYFDTPVFLDVTSVINSYTLQSEVNLGLTFKQGAENSQTLGGKGIYSDRPTISYVPLMGDKFTKSLLTPTKPETIFTLIQVGWRADLLMRITIKSINGIYNEGSRGREQPVSDMRFSSLIQAFRRIQLSNAVGMKMGRTEDGETPLLFFRREVPEEIQKDILYVRETLRLDPEAEEFNLRFGPISSNDKEVALLTRSMLEVLVAISSGIEVPQEHLEMNRAAPAPPDIGLEPLIRIRSGEEKPKDVFVAIPYKNHWFWIEDTDLDSKKLFTFLIFLFNLTETGDTINAPLMTIQAG